MTFNANVQASIAPWDDPNGFWSTYNAAIAGMFETVYGIVADLGDANQTVVATLSSGLSTTSAITSLPVQSVSETLGAGTEISLAFAQSTQTFVLSANASPGNTTIFVNSQTPNFAYPIGTPVQLTYIPGWSTLLDPNNCPAQFLLFLAQFNGTVVPSGLDAVTARAKILGESAQQRGTARSIISAVQRNLTGTQSVILEERIDSLGNPNAYWFVVVVRPEEVVSLSGLTAAVNAVKPGGVQWTLVQTDGWTITQMEASQLTITALEGNFATIHGLENDQPGT